MAGKTSDPRRHPTCNPTRQRARNAAPPNKYSPRHLRLAWPGVFRRPLCLAGGPSMASDPVLSCRGRRLTIPQRRCADRCHRVAYRGFRRQGMIHHHSGHDEPDLARGRSCLGTPRAQGLAHSRRSAGWAANVLAPSAPRPISAHQAMGVPGIPPLKSSGGLVTPSLLAHHTSMALLLQGEGSTGGNARPRGHRIGIGCHANSTSLCKRGTPGRLGQRFDRDESRPSSPPTQTWQLSKAGASSLTLLSRLEPLVGKPQVPPGHLTLPPEQGRLEPVIGRTL